MVILMEAMSALRILAMVFLLVTTARSQTLKGIIVDARTKQPIAFAHVVPDGTNRGTSADLDGRFTLEIPLPSTLTVSCVGYLTATVAVQSTTVSIELLESPVNLQEVVVMSGENPANAIMRKVFQNIPQNDPHQFKSFTYTSYNKLYIDAPADAKIVTLDTTLAERLDSGTLFFLESIVVHKFQHPAQYHEHIEAQKTSGTKSAALAPGLTNIQPMSFYDEWFFMKATNKFYFNPLFDRQFNKYRFEILDTLYNGTDSTFVLAFEPAPTRKFEALKGVLYINTNGYALENVLASSNNAVDALAFTFQQRYERVEGRWFPVQISTDLMFQDVKGLYYGVRYVHKSYFSSIRFDDRYLPNDFPITTFDVAFDASDKTPLFWDDHRPVQLSPRESGTYRYFQNTPDATTDGFLRSMEYLSLGYIPTKYINLPTNRFLSFNQHEGLRIGMGLQSNERLLRAVSFGGYAAYGFNDHGFKHGAHVQLRFQNRLLSQLTASYQRDVAEPASTIAIEPDQRALLPYGLRGLLTSRMDSLQRFDINFSTYLNKKSFIKLNALHETRQPLYDYSYHYNDGTNSLFVANELSVYLRYTMEQERGAPNRLFSFVKPQRRVELKVAKSFDLSEGDIEYFRVQLAVKYSLRFVALGSTSLYATSGYVQGVAPYPYLFNGTGTSRSIWFPFLENTFQSVAPYEFVMDRYASLFIVQNVGALIFKSSSPYSQPEILLSHGIMWGDITNAERHQGIAFATPSRGYYEAGVMVSRLLRVRYLFNLGFIDFGVAAFYRYGPYAFAQAGDNLFTKVLVGFSF